MVVQYNNNSVILNVLIEIIITSQIHFTWCTRRVICEGIAEEYFKLSYGDYTDGDYSHGSHSQSISSPEWEPLEQDVDEGDDLVMLMMRWSEEAEGIYSAKVVLICVTMCSVNYCSSGRKRVIFLLIPYGGKLWHH